MPSPGQPAVGLPLPHALLAARAARQPGELRRPRTRRFRDIGQGQQAACHFAETITDEAVAKPDGSRRRSCRPTRWTHAPPRVDA